MVKGNPKSSSTSGTRKKHARKAAGAPDSKPVQQPKTKTSKKDRKNAPPRVKQYIPPTKPAKAVLDPLDTLGLARILPAELVVCLRMLGKKSGVTREKGLEELKRSWLGSDKEIELIQMSPVWVHHLPSLLTHPQRRIRLLAATIHATMLSNENIRDNVLSLTSEDTNATATWLLSVYDIDRTVASTSAKSWNYVAPQPDSGSLVEFISRTLLDPAGVWLTLNPPTPQAPLSSPTRAKGPKSLNKLYHSNKKKHILSSPFLYTSLCATEVAPWTGTESFAFAQPGLRKAAWSVVLDPTEDKDVVNLVAVAALTSAFTESDLGVQSVMWASLLRILNRGRQQKPSFVYPEEGGEESDEDDQDEEPPPSSPAKDRITSSPQIISLISMSLSYSPQCHPPIKHFTPLLLDSMWQATESPILTSGLGITRLQAQEAFISAYTECVLLFSRRLGTNSVENGVALEEQSRKIVSWVLGLGDSIRDRMRDNYQAVLCQTGNIIRKRRRRGATPVSIGYRGERFVRSPIACFDYSRSFGNPRQWLRGWLGSPQSASHIIPHFLVTHPSTDGQILTSAIVDHSVLLLEQDSGIFSSFLTHPPSEEARQQLWTATLENVNSKVDALLRLVNIIESSNIPALTGQADAVFSELLSSVLSSQTVEVKESGLLSRALQSNVREQFMSQLGFDSLLENISAIFVARVEDILFQPEMPLGPLNLPLGLIDNGRVEYSVPKTFASQVSPGIFKEKAQRIWNALEGVANMLRRVLKDGSGRVTLSILSTIPQHPISSSLGVLDPITPPLSSYEEIIEPLNQHTCTTYARILTAVVHAISEDRLLGKRNMWILEHTERIRGIVTYLVNGGSLDSTAVALAIRNSQGRGGGELGDVIVDLIQKTTQTDSFVGSRALKRILVQYFESGDVNKDDAEVWLDIARGVEKAAPTLCTALLWCITQHLPSPPTKLDRYRTELASALLGIKPSDANTLGLTTLRKLNAVAPKDDSDVVFMTQQRAVNVVKAFQAWAAADDEDDEGGVDEEVESEMICLSRSLVPILQSVGVGSHWEMIWDLVETSLDSADLSDDTTMTSLARTLRLVIALLDVQATNRVLREAWVRRVDGVLKSVRDLAGIRFEGESGSSKPKSVCRELILEIVRDLPSGLVERDTLPKMCHLLTDSSLLVQKMSYQLLHTAARKHTEDLVIEAGVDTEDAVKIELPLELLDLLQRTIDDEDETPVVIGWLLSWMLLFDCFEDASLKVRMAYLTQLRASTLVEEYFLPNIWHLLKLDLGMAKAFKMETWGVDDFFIQLLDVTDTFSLAVFAGHVYYRALLVVRSLIQQWVLECKDRQLSSAIMAYTSQHFSPVIVQAELASLKDPSVLSDLTDENMSVKVATSVNEVLASYLIDEQVLEIRLRIPPDWPLHKIDVRDSKHAGVEETRWRAWVFNVQQIIWAQNGRISDALGVFKKNVEGHFEGQVECAICYSIISVMDGQLPKKPCKTCKNRFHSSCLYKWFNSSHSSSCPLCRSDIF
ncbi:hypothetical protein DL96DRAFT_1604472 [Flagelloscypha sp. PMI_526]|nr:hypothetical protein DL96DRAFT_1604472 [Flagelloscypha sp. PMI_526]